MRASMEQKSKIASKKTKQIYSKMVNCRNVPLGKLQFLQYCTQHWRAFANSFATVLIWATFTINMVHFQYLAKIL